MIRGEIAGELLVDRLNGQRTTISGGVQRTSGCFPRVHMRTHKHPLRSATLVKMSRSCSMSISKGTGLAEKAEFNRTDVAERIEWHARDDAKGDRSKGGASS